MQWTGEASAQPDTLQVAQPEFKLDAAPLLPGCECYACQNHTRGYVHHLLDAQEMLARTLLECHNTHHMQLFMQAARAAISQGSFASFQRALTAHDAEMSPVRGPV